jgi:PKD repeat protein
VTVTGTNGTLVHATSIAVTVTAPRPTARFTYEPASPKAKEIVAFDASSSTDSDPGATLQARWDWQGDGVWDTSFSSTLTATHAFASTGAYTVNLEILDSHGITDTTRQVITVLATGSGDQTPPHVMILSPENATVVTTPNVTVTGIASDNLGIRSVELSTDNVTWTPASGTAAWSGTVSVNEGTNTIYARATDTAGNRKTVQVVVTVEIPEGVPPQEPPSIPLSESPPFPLLQIIVIVAAGAAAEVALYVTYHRIARKAGRKEETDEPSSRRDPP